MRQKYVFIIRFLSIRKFTLNLFLNCIPTYFSCKSLDDRRANILLYHFLSPHHPALMVPPITISWPTLQPSRLSIRSQRLLGRLLPAKLFHLSKTALNHRIAGLLLGAEANDGGGHVLGVVWVELESGGTG